MALGLRHTQVLSECPVSCLPLIGLHRAPGERGRGRGIQFGKLRCALFLGTQRAFLQQLGMRGWGGAALAVWDKGTVPPASAQLGGWQWATSSHGGAVSNTPPARAPGFPFLRQWRFSETSSCLAPSPIGQFLEEAPRKVLIPSRVQGSGRLGGFPGTILGCAGRNAF